MHNQPGEQVPQSLKKEIKKNVSLDYLLYLPEEYESKPEWPLVIFLHGAGERGDDLARVKIHGPAKLVDKGKSFPFILISPQCPANRRWTDELDALGALLDDISQKYRIDPNRISVTGLSMGGQGVWALALAYPQRFSALAPVCGRSYFYQASRIKHIPAWIFHGAKDNVVPIAESDVMAAALKKHGGDVKYTVYPEANHDSWTATYNNPELYEWLLGRQRRND
ncbi:MAG: phospholipase [Calditrichaeota bacterium]|nr:MAG: phospholipase [Calditrichota bacterium]